METKLPIKKNQKSQEVLVTTKPKGRVFGPLIKAAGYVGMAVSVISIPITGALTGLISFIATGAFSASVGNFFGLVPALALSAWAIYKGSAISSRVDRFYQYAKQLGGRTYINLIELANSMGKSPKFVIKDVQKMIDLGMFPKGRFDDEQTTLILSNESYKAYQKMIEGEKIREEAEAKQKELEEKRRLLAQSNPTYNDVIKVVKEGEATIARIKQINVNIENVEVHQQVSILLEITEKIYAFLEENTDQLDEVRKFISYYLPTMEKLVNTYEKLEEAPAQGKNIKSTKREIEESLGTMNKAFIKMLDGFYRDTALDVSTDITVLENMLSQEGLTDKYSIKESDKNE